MCSIQVCTWHLLCSFKRYILFPLYLIIAVCHTGARCVRKKKKKKYIILLLYSFFFFQTHLTPVVCHAVRRLFLKLYIHVSGITVLIIFEELPTSIGVLVSSGVDHDRAPDNFQVQRVNTPYF